MNPLLIVIAILLAVNIGLLCYAAHLLDMIEKLSRISHDHPAQTTLLHAAELLEAEAKEIHGGYWNNSKNVRNWEGVPEAKGSYDDLLVTALELRLLARSIQTGHAAVPPAPTFEGETLIDQMG